MADAEVRLNECFGSGRVLFNFTVLRELPGERASVLFNMRGRKGPVVTKQPGS